MGFRARGWISIMLCNKFALVLGCRAGVGKAEVLVVILFLSWAGYVDS